MSKLKDYYQDEIDRMDETDQAFQSSMADGEDQWWAEQDSDEKWIAEMTKRIDEAMK